MRYGALLSNAVDVALRAPFLALVPLLTGLSRWTDVLKTASRSGTRVGIHFGMPYPPADLWTFVDEPRTSVRTVGMDGHTVDASVLVDLLAIGVVVLVVRSLLVAGYLGSIDQFLEESRYEFFENVLTYGVRILAFQAVVFAAILALVGTGLVDTVLLLALFPFVLVLAYVFYLTPYLIVVEDRRTVDAFRRSAILTTDRISAAVFFVLYAILVAGISVPLSVVVNAGLLGVVLAAVVASGAGHVLTTFAVLFARDLVGLEPVPVSEGTVVDGAASS